MMFIVFGPTGSGKTDLVVKLITSSRKEKNIFSEVISADSRQIYKGLNIGTNKDVEKYVENNIPYNLIDLINPDEKFSVYDWNQKTKLIIDRCKAQKKDIYIVGGTGLYIDSILYPRKYKNNSVNNYLSAEFSLSELQNNFQKKFPKEYLSLNHSEKNNKRRLENKYKILNSENLVLDDKKLLTGKILSKEKNNFVLEKKDFKILSPKYERSQLYAKINKRVDEMFQNGLVDEVKLLIDKGYRETEVLTGTGYKEVVSFLDGKISLDKCKELIKKSHRNYAKRQITWFRKYYKDFAVKEIAIDGNI